MYAYDTTNKQLWRTDYYQNRALRVPRKCEVDSSGFVYVMVEEADSWSVPTQEHYIHGFDASTGAYFGYLNMWALRGPITMGASTYFAVVDQTAWTTTVYSVAPNSRRDGLNATVMFKTNVLIASSLAPTDDGSGDIIIGSQNCILTRFTMSGDLKWKTTILSLSLATGGNSWCSNDALSTIDTPGVFAAGAITYIDLNTTSLGFTSVPGRNIGYFGYNPITGNIYWIKNVAGTTNYFTSIALETVSKMAYLMGSYSYNKIFFIGANYSGNNPAVNVYGDGTTPLDSFSLSINNQLGIGIATYGGKIEYFQVPKEGSPGTSTGGYSSLGSTMVMLSTLVVIGQSNNDVSSYISTSSIIASPGASSKNLRSISLPPFRPGSSSSSIAGTNDTSLNEKTTEELPIWKTFYFQIGVVVVGFIGIAFLGYKIYKAARSNGNGIASDQPVRRDIEKINATVTDYRREDPFQTSSSYGGGEPTASSGSTQMTSMSIYSGTRTEVPTEMGKSFLLSFII